MKAIQIKQTGGPEVMELVELPVPQPKSNEVVVKIAAAGVNFIDVYNREGRYKAVLPLVLGQEAAGAVSAVGSDVKDFAVGDRVAYAGVMGSYAEFAAVAADRVVKVPEGVTDRDAAAAMLQGMTAHYLACDTYPLKKGQTALVHAAAGGVGSLLVQMAHNIGARVIATVSTPEKAALAKESGADEVILYMEADFEAETKRLTGGKGVDVVYDSVGKTTFDKGLNVAASSGDDGAVWSVERGGCGDGSTGSESERVAVFDASYVSELHSDDSGIARAGGSCVWDDPGWEVEVESGACVSAQRRAASAS